MTAHEYSIQTGVISQKTHVASSCQIASKFHWRPALIENPAFPAFLLLSLQTVQTSRYEK